MAAPHVTGAWALFKQKYPTGGVATLLNHFQTTGAAATLKAGDAGGGSVKRIDVQAALNAVGSIGAPTGLSTALASTSSIALNWTDNSSDETEFQIERSTSGASNSYSQIATTGTGVTTFTNGALTDGTTYYYRVRAYNGTIASAYTAAANATTPLSTQAG
jgi:hypothetical protein